VPPTSENVSGTQVVMQSSMYGVSMHSPCALTCMQSAGEAVVATRANATSWGTAATASGAASLYVSKMIFPAGAVFMASTQPAQGCSLSAMRMEVLDTDR